MHNVIALLTDFGCRSGYAAQVKATILKHVEHIEKVIQFIDISHNIRSFQIDQAGFVLKLNYKWFPKNSLFLVVVDPGVGTDRAVIGVKSHDMVFIAPDNGVLSSILTDIEKIVAIKGTSATFAGRDVFAKAAAELISGKQLEEIGTEYKRQPKLIEIEPEITDSTVSGKVLHIDDFGNVISNIESSLIYQGNKVKWGNIIVSEWVKNYSQIEKCGKKIGNIINSSGYLELAAFKNSAEKLTDLKIGSIVKAASIK
ncbi:MAG: hypothetical protein IEMM0003_0371 [bacterium]|nr:MAG: hypothetical protein IEMM0003_0371 [bacterium]